MPNLLPKDLSKYDISVQEFSNYTSKIKSVNMHIYIYTLKRSFFK